MGFAIELYFDAESEKSVRDLWMALAKTGISSQMVETNARPHISLATIQRTDASVLTIGLAEFAKRTAPIELKFSAVGSFPTEEGVTFLVPVVTGELLKIHERFHTWLNEANIISNDYYAPGIWVPHCTVTFHNRQIKSARPLLFANNSKEFTAVFKLKPLVWSNTIPLKH